MKYVFTLLLFSLLSAGCSSSNDNNPVPDNDETSDPTTNPGDGDDTPDAQDDPPAASVSDKINMNNYADLISLVEDVGFHTFTRTYNLGALTKPFTSFTNALFEDPNVEAQTLDDTQDCDIAGTTDTSGNIYAGSEIFSIQYDFHECQTIAGSINGTAVYDVERVNIDYIKHEFDIEFTNVDIQGERGDRVVKGVFNYTDEVIMNFDVTSYVIKVPGLMFLEVSGSGRYQSKFWEEVVDPTDIVADSNLDANFIFTTSTGDGSNELTVDVETNLYFESTDLDEVGPGSPVAGSLTISADDNSQVVVSPSDVLGMVYIDLTAADGAVSRDTRSWFDFATEN